ncbi:Growth_factor receptor cysteine-rich domain superfamily [Hexamita inflata]|uniref:Growth factor receptor cysteine-rich domain superfamily n=1 Tax=Hexamita inflata TaxID=28002 RepID=A0AA86P8M6_9EUKA|nr:Growth factor receptor cysteine-rich domain superfamily [Hexamita inflata]CAI9974292.1 Growth factor receptor cysteine-rich domain superfamily [Hexamita inflata]
MLQYILTLSIVCAVNYWDPGTGCQPCPAGISTSDGTETTCHCSDGTFDPANNLCTCASGYFFKGGVCTECPPGISSVTSDYLCAPVPTDLSIPTLSSVFADQTRSQRTTPAFRVRSGYQLRYRMSHRAPVPTDPSIPMLSSVFADQTRS